MRRRSGTCSGMDWPTASSIRSTLSTCPRPWMTWLIWLSEWKLGYDVAINDSFLGSVVDAENQFSMRLRIPPISVLILNPCKWAELVSLRRREMQSSGSLPLLWCCGSHRTTVFSKSRSPSLERRLLTGGFTFHKSYSTTTHLLVQRRVGHTTFLCKALIDSGAEGNFLDRKTALKLGVPLVPLNHSISVSALWGQSLPPITHVTEPVSLITSSNHSDYFFFF